MKKNNLEDSILELKKHFRKQRDKKIFKTIENKVEELKSNVNQKIEEVKNQDSFPSEFLSDTEVLKADFMSKINTLIVEFNDKFSSLENLSEASARLTRSSFMKETEDIKKAQKNIKETIDENISELRTELIQRLSRLGGGSMNRKISINGVAMSTRFTDVNYIGSGAPTAADNLVTKQVDLTFSGGSSSGFQQPTSGDVDGSNATYTWTTAPSVISVDQGRVMQKVSSDGTVNWTGTTTTILAVAPNSDIFAIA